MQEGTLAPAGSVAGLSFVNGLNGINGTIEVTGTLSAIQTAFTTGIIYTGPQGFSGDTMTVTVNDGYWQTSQTFQFDSQGHIPNPPTVSDGPGVLTSDIYVADLSAGTTGTVLDNPAYMSTSNPLVLDQAHQPVAVLFSTSVGTQQLWIDQSRAAPNTNPATFQKYGEVFSVPTNESDLHSVSLTVSAPTQATGGATQFELRLYKWTAGAPDGPAIYDSGAVALGSNGSGIIVPTAFPLTLDVPVQAGQQYIFEIIGNGAIGLGNAAANAGDALYVQSGNGTVFNAWSPAGNASLFTELDFQPALTTTGTLGFTDINDTHTVSVSSDASVTWGNLVAYVSNDTTGTNAVGAVAWIYEVDPAKAASLALGEVHYDTFALTLVDSTNGTATTNVTVAVDGVNETPWIVSGNPNIPLPAIHFHGDALVANGFLTPDTATSGTLTFHEADLSDTHTVTATLTGATWSGGSGSGSFSAGSTVDDLPPEAFDKLKAALQVSIPQDSTWTGTGTIDWSLKQIAAYQTHFLDQVLGPDQTLTLTYTITVNDPHLGANSQTLTVVLDHIASAFIGWINPGDGDWNDAANWSTGTVPTASDVVHIPDEQILNGSGSYHVTNSGANPDPDGPNPAAHAKSIVLREGGVTLTNTGTLTIVQDLIAQHGSTVENSGTLTATSAGLDPGSTLTNSGYLQLTNAFNADGSTITNTVDGQIDANAVSLTNTQPLTNTSTLTNDGIFNLTGSSSFSDAILANHGSIEVLTGTLTLDQATAVGNTGGTITVDGGATLALNVASVTDGNLEVLGTLTSDAADALHNVTLDNDGIVTVVTGTLTLDQATAVGNTGGTITVDGGATLALNVASVTDGSLEVLGTLSSDAADALHNVTLDNDGIITVVTGTLTLDQATAVGNTGGTITVDGGATLALNVASVTDGSLEVLGTLTSDAADALHNVTLDNDGIITVVTGTLTLDQATAVGNTGGTITVDGGATLALDVASVTDGSLEVLGTLTSDAADALHNVTLDNDGTITVVTGTLTLDQATAVGNTGGTITVDGGATLALDVASVTDGDLEVLGTLTSDAADALHNVTLDNDGIITVVTGTLTLDQATAVGNTGGTITVDGGATLALNVASVTDGSLEVLGTLTSDAADALHNVTLDNDGTVTVVTGTLTLDQATAVGNTGGTITVDGGATLALNVASVTDGDLEVLGTLSSDAADALHNVTLDNDGTITVVTGTLTLDQATAVGNTGGTDHGRWRRHAGARCRQRHRRRPGGARHAEQRRRRRAA